jgi:hypothetical protein
MADDTVIYTNMYIKSKQAAVQYNTWAMQIYRKHQEMESWL